jgi:hypothetical protein
LRKLEEFVELAKAYEEAAAARENPRRLRKPSSGVLFLLLGRSRASLKLRLIWRKVARAG